MFSSCKLYYLTIISAYYGENQKSIKVLGYLWVFFIFEMMSKIKKFLIDDKKLEELGDIIIQKIEKYIDKKLKPLLDKSKEKIEYVEMNFLWFPYLKCLKIYKTYLY